MKHKYENGKEKLRKAFLIKKQNVILKICGESSQNRKNIVTGTEALIRQQVI